MTDLFISQSVWIACLWLEFRIIILCLIDLLRMCLFQLFDYLIISVLPPSCLFWNGTPLCISSAKSPRMYNLYETFHRNCYHCQHLLTCRRSLATVTGRQCPFTLALRSLSSAGPTTETYHTDWCGPTARTRFTTEQGYYICVKCFNFGEIPSVYISLFHSPIHTSYSDKCYYDLTQLRC